MEFSTTRLEQIAKILAEEIKEQMAEKQGIHEMEQTMRELVKAAAGLGLQQAIEQGEERYAQKEIECACGAKAKFVSNRAAVLWTVFGKVGYQRRYYLCTECHQGQSPLDQKYRIVPGQVTQALASLLGVLGVEVAFEEASQLAERFLLFRVSDNTVRKQTEGYGNAQAQAEKEWMEKAEDEPSLQVRERSLEYRSGRIYASIDGAHVPLQQEWRELKTLCWYHVEPTPKNHSGQPVGEQNHLHAKDVQYYCDIMEAEQFGRLLWATGIQNNVDTYEEVVFVSDGAVWIWRLVEHYFPQAVQIVDWYHACQYLAPIAEAAFGAGASQAQEWLTQVQTDLWEGRIQEVLLACRTFLPHAHARPFAEKAITYYANNEKRMDYARFRQQGYLIGSGTIESACKQIAAARLKCSGARWTLAGVIATAKARAAWLSNAWDNLKPFYLNLSTSP
ncbi:MAG: ISKra4 family transposase [Anaerolineae bacterium]|nr:ISKra4 family transposase [Anaerolineae bacterium]MBL8104306.1 ISKra4 family transposase [Anaerolineales bacterium]MCC7188953.1 ISKra4 family transposase [Anaerolineales bacterium]